MDAYQDLADDFDTTIEGYGMPKGNKKAGFIGLMLAKKHLRRTPNDYENGRPKKTPARFNSNLMADVNRHGQPNPSAYIQAIYPRRQQPQQQQQAPRLEVVQRRQLPISHLLAD